MINEKNFGPKGITACPYCGGLCRVEHTESGYRYTSEECACPALLELVKEAARIFKAQKFKPSERGSAENKWLWLAEDILRVDKP